MPHIFLLIIKWENVFKVSKIYKVSGYITSFPFHKKIKYQLSQELEKKINILPILHYCFWQKNYLSLVLSKQISTLKGTNRHSTNGLFSLTNCLNVVPDECIWSTTCWYVLTFGTKLKESERKQTSHGSNHLWNLLG